MKSITQASDLPDLTADILSNQLMPVDNIFARLWNTMKIPALLKRAGFEKRSGLKAPEVVYVLLLWTWLKAGSIYMFSRESLQSFADARKDVMYDFLKREDVNWRGFHMQTARKVYQDHKLKDCKIKAFVVDDSVKIRSGKKMGGVSRHFDHLTGKSVKGQQVLTLGFATETTFLPLDQDIFISQVQVQEAQEFQDNRSIAAKRYKQSLELTKPQLLAASLKRAVNSGFEADYFIGDAWFGNKPTLRLSEECNVTAIFRMKKDKTQYRLSIIKNGVIQYQMLSAVELFKQVVRKQWDKISGAPYKAKFIDVEINLAEKNEAGRWRKVRLLFVRGVNCDDKPQAGKHDWAMFLCTDCKLTPEEILEIYALRWGIEVYFKESKQYLGLLKEQTITFTSHIASITLTAVRYLMLLYAALEQNKRVCDVRNELSDGLLHLCFGQRLWAMFRCLISDTVEEFRTEFGDLAERFMAALEQRINAFFTQALQMDSFTLELEARPDKA